MSGFEDLMIPWPGWQVVREIGKGGYGTVYEIERTQHGITENDALKVIRIPKNKQEYEELVYRNVGTDDDDSTISQYFSGQKNRVIEEIKAMQKLKSTEHIVGIKDWDIRKLDDGYSWEICIRMDLLTPLPKYIKKSGNLSERQIIRLGIDICKALEQCEREGIVHRDIKPDNIMVSETGKYMLGDFGIARSLENETTMTGIGSKPYMSPEVYNHKKAGKTVDIYSLGVVLYELLNNNRPPFINPNGKINPIDREKAIQRRISGEIIPKPANGSDRMKRIVFKACSVNPEKRYQTARGMRRALEDAFKESSDIKTEAEEKSERHRASHIRADGDKNGSWNENNVTVGADRIYDSKSDVISDDDTYATEGADYKEESIHGTTKQDDYNKEADDISEKGAGDKTAKIFRSKKWGPLVAAAIVLSLVLGFFTVHIYSEGTCTEPATCKICGKTKGTAPGHDWKEATCTEVAYCLRCGEEGEEALGHDWEPATCTEPESCSRCSETRGEALGHDWEAATYDKPKTCKRCGETEGEERGVITNITGKWSEKEEHVSKSRIKPFKLDKAIVNCKWIDIGVTISDVAGAGPDGFKIYFKSNGKWEYYWNFNPTEYEEEQVERYNADNATIEAIAVIPNVEKYGGEGGTHYRWAVSIPKAQVVESDKSYAVGKTYTVQTNLRVREGPGMDNKQLKRSDLTEEDKKIAEPKLKDAVLKKGSKVTCQEMSGNWMRISSGWICVWDYGEVLVK